MKINRRFKSLESKIKNKNIMIIIIGLILICGFVVAEGTLNRTDKTLTLNKERIDSIKQYTGINSIAPTASAITCDDSSCYSKIYQEGLINSIWIGQKNKCLEFKNQSNECISSVPYTSNELEKQRDDYILYRLSLYADAIKERTKIPVEVVGEGTITIR